MKRFARTVMLKDDPQIIRQYENYHSNIWPEVVKGAISSGIVRLYIYRWGRQLFMFMETKDDYDPQRSMAALLADPRVRDWEEKMRSFQEAWPGAPEDSTWSEMDEIFAWEA